jgi:hypothetical protein
MKDILILIGLFAALISVWYYMRRVETFEDPICSVIHRNLIKVDPRAQKLSIKGSNQSFTEDKLRVYLCLYDENGQYYDINMLMYVALHELAHAISYQVDPAHKTDEFKNNFKMLLDKAASIGVYDKSKPLNYSYCPKSKEIQNTNGGN